MRARFASISLLLLAIATSGCEGAALATSTPVAPAGPRSVHLAEDVTARLGIRTAVAGSPLAIALTVPGAVEYHVDRFAEVGARLDGRLVEVRAKLGDKVHKGQVLAMLAAPTLGDAHAALVRAKALREAATTNATREASLLAKGLTTAREEELARSELKTATAEVIAAEARLSALGVLGGGAGTFALTSPIDGVVVARNATLGAFLPASATAFAVADLSTVVIAADVHEADLPHLAHDAVVEFRADALGERVFRGKVAWIDPAVHPVTRMTRARLEVVNTDRALRPGMFVRASLALPSPNPSTKQLLLPIDAVQPLGGDDVVFVEKAKGVFEVRTVQVAKGSGRLAAVTSGLAIGEAVVVEGAFLLRAEAAKR